MTDKRKDVVFVAPMKFQVGELEWRVLYEAWAKSGKTIPASKVKDMFPEQFPNRILKDAKVVDKVG